MKKKYPCRFPGFTLIELLFVLLIIGMVLGMCQTIFINLKRSTGVHGASRTIVTILRTARQKAISENAIFIVDFDKTLKSVSIIDAKGQLSIKTYRLPNMVDFYNDANKLDDIQFFPNGRAIKLGGGAAINSIWVTSEKPSPTSDRITVLASTGRVLLRKDQPTP